MSSLLTYKARYSTIRYRNLSRKKEVIMKKFVPAEKLSKKEKRKLNALKRGSWNGLNPVTRKPENPKAYKRKKMHSIDEDFNDVHFLFISFC